MDKTCVSLFLNALDTVHYYFIGKEGIHILGEE